MKPQHKGFTLAELLLAFFFLTVAGLAIMALFTQGMDQYRRLDTATITSHLLEQRMETVMASSLDDVQSSSGAFPAPFSDYQQETSVQIQPDGVKQVEVEVRGPGNTVRRLKALRAPNSIPQGMAVYLKYDCWTCHSNTKVPANYQNLSGIAPSLTNPGIFTTAQSRLSSDPALSTSVLNFTGGTDPEDYVEFSIRRPSDFYVSGYDPGSTSGVSMPEYGADIMSEAELRSLIRWLSDLDTTP